MLRVYIHILWENRDRPEVTCCFFPSLVVWPWTSYSIFWAPISCQMGTRSPSGTPRGLRETLWEKYKAQGYLTGSSHFFSFFFRENPKNTSIRNMNIWGELLLSVLPTENRMPWCALAAAHSDHQAALLPSQRLPKVPTSGPDELSNSRVSALSALNWKSDEYIFSFSFFLLVCISFEEGFEVQDKCIKSLSDPWFCYAVGSRKQFLKSDGLYTAVAIWKRMTPPGVGELGVVTRSSEHARGCGARAAARGPGTASRGSVQLAPTFSDTDCWGLATWQCGSQDQERQAWGPPSQGLRSSGLGNGVRLTCFQWQGPTQQRCLRKTDKAARELQAVGTGLAFLFFTAHSLGKDAGDLAARASTISTKCGVLSFGCIPGSDPTLLKQSECWERASAETIS